MRETIAVVLVTYNRKQLLIECLEAIRNQIHKPDAIYIIDNLSTDGTPELLVEKKYIAQLPLSDLKENQLIKHQVSSLSKPLESIKINYVRKFKNDGGAGGFYIGIKLAFEDGFDWIWCMDDDGRPNENTLENLIIHACADDIILHPLVLAEDHNTFSFGCWLFTETKEQKLLKTLDELKVFLKNNDDVIIPSYGTPFNGTLIPRKVVQKIGYPNLKYFIWGDESEYMFRIVKNGFLSYHVLDAIYFHPHNPLIYTPLEFNTKDWWKLYYLYRNRREVLSYFNNSRIIATAKYMKYNLVSIVHILINNKEHKWYKVYIIFIATIHSLIGKYGKYNIAGRLN